MRAEYFGDSYDVVKKFLIERLIFAGFFVGINPMNNGSDEYLPKYYNFLGANDDIDNKTAIFIDPDTGIGRRDTQTHVSYDRISHLCDKYKCVMIFDQGFSRNINQPVAIRNKINNFQAQGIQSMYYMSHACFCFCCKNNNDLLNVRNSIIQSGLPESRLII
jgi:hypothetical protein